MQGRNYVEEYNTFLSWKGFEEKQKSEPKSYGVPLSVLKGTVQQDGSG